MRTYFRRFRCQSHHSPHTSRLPDRNRGSSCSSIPSRHRNTADRPFPLLHQARRCASPSMLTTTAMETSSTHYRPPATSSRVPATQIGLRDLECLVLGPTANRVDARPSVVELLQLV